MSDTREFVLRIGEVDRIELNGVRRATDEKLEYGGKEYDDWPDELHIQDSESSWVLFVLEETDEGFGVGITPDNEYDPRVSQAWYALKESEPR